MREIIKNIKFPIDGKEMDFRLKKLDAFSGVMLMRCLAKMPDNGNGSALTDMLMSLPAEDLQSIMISCLNHTEVLLPAGYQPVMQGSAWSWDEIQYDCVSCLKLAIEEIVWTLSGFFGGGGSASRAARPNT